MPSEPPPGVHYNIQEPRRLKNLVDILAEIDDWYAKEIASGNPWEIPDELFNFEQKRETIFLSLKHGFGEAMLLALVTPFLYALYIGSLDPLSELNEIGKLIVGFVLGWPYFVLPFFPLIFSSKIRGTVTKILCSNLAYARAIGLILGSLIACILYYYSPVLAEYLAPIKADYWAYYVNSLFTKAVDHLQGSILWLLVGGFFSAMLPVLCVHVYSYRAQTKWKEIEELTRGVI